MISEISSEFLDQLCQQPLSYEDFLNMLNFIQNDKRLIENAVDVLDSLQYIQKVCSNGRFFYIIPGSRGKDYLCMENYCTCPRYSEILKHPTINNTLCKHQIVSKIAFQFGKVKEKVLVHLYY